MRPGSPLARLLVSSLVGRPAERVARRRPYVPPSDGPSSGGGSLSASTAIERCVLLLRWTLTDEPVGPIHEWLGADAVVWTPASYTRGIAGVVGSTHELCGDALTEIAIDIVSADVVEGRVYLEWRLAGRFAEPCFIDDDLLVEPTGRLVEAAGVLVARFHRDEVVSLHCYYDEMAVLEQIVAER